MTSLPLAKPYAFYTEGDLRCHLYPVLWTLGLSRGCRVKVNGRILESPLLHREYPAKGRYRSYGNRESEEDARGKQEHLDLCIWDHH